MPILPEPVTRNIAAVDSDQDQRQSLEKQEPVYHDSLEVDEDKVPPSPPNNHNDQETKPKNDDDDDNSIISTESSTIGSP